MSYELEQVFCTFPRISRTFETYISDCWPTDQSLAVAVRVHARYSQVRGVSHYVSQSVSQHQFVLQSGFLAVSQSFSRPAEQEINSMRIRQSVSHLNIMSVSQSQSNTQSVSVSQSCQSVSVLISEPAKSEWRQIDTTIRIRRHTTTRGSWRCGRTRLNRLTD